MPLRVKSTKQIYKTNLQNKSTKQIYKTNLQNKSTKQIYKTRAIQKQKVGGGKTDSKGYSGSSERSSLDPVSELSAETSDRSVHNICGAFEEGMLHRRAHVFLEVAPPELVDTLVSNVLNEPVTLGV